MLLKMNAPKEESVNHSLESWKSANCRSCVNYSAMITPSGPSPFKHEEDVDTPPHTVKYYTKQGFCWHHKDDLFVTRACGAFQRK
jgi:hypothetical protein